MSDKIDVMIKRAGLALLHAQNLSCTPWDGHDDKRTKEIGQMMTILEDYLKSRGADGLNAELNDAALEGEDLSALIVGSEEATKALAYQRAVDAQLEAMKKATI